MNKVLKPFLYTAIALGAIFVALTVFDKEPQADFSALDALRAGDMKKLNFTDPKPFVATAFVGENGEAKSFKDFKGHYTLVNFWATWCAPCRKEMPTLDALAKTFDGKGLTVATIATGRNAPPAIDKFFNDIGVEMLPKYLDPNQALARDMSILGLPVTVLLNKDGREVARLTGDAHWNSPEAVTILTALIAGD